MSPTVSELIEQKQAERNAVNRKLREEATLAANIKANEILRLKHDEETRNNQKLENDRRRQEYVRSKSREIINSSGLAKGLKEIEQMCLQGINKHDFVVDLDEGKMTLVWGSKYRLDKTAVGYEPQKYLFIFDSTYGEINCSSIECSINIDTEEISINSRIISKNQWKNNIELINNCLAEAYMNPIQRRARQEPRDDRYSSSSTTNSECCNS